MKNEQFRQLTTAERHLVERLLEEDFPGREAISRQVQHSLVRRIDADGSLEFSVGTNETADVKWRVPTEGWSKDIDGTMIHALLHIVDGQVKELEIYKADGSQIIKMPEPAELQLFQPH